MRIYKFISAIILLLFSSSLFSQSGIEPIESIDKLLKDRHFKFCVAYTNRPLDNTGFCISADTLKVNLNFNGVAYNANSYMGDLDKEFKFISHKFKIIEKTDSKKNKFITILLKDNPNISSINLIAMKKGFPFIVINSIDASTVSYPGYIAPL